MVFLINQDEITDLDQRRPKRRRQKPQSQIQGETKEVPLRVLDQIDGPTTGETTGTTNLINSEKTADRRGTEDRNFLISSIYPVKVMFILYSYYNYRSNNLYLFLCVLLEILPN